MQVSVKDEITSIEALVPVLIQMTVSDITINIIICKYGFYRHVY